MAVKNAKANESWEDRKVRIRLFQDAGKYKDDVKVLVNGKCYIIQRGKEVDVPFFVWDVLRKGMDQDFRTATLIQTEEESFKRKEKDFT